MCKHTGGVTVSLIDQAFAAKASQKGELQGSFELGAMSLEPPKPLRSFLVGDVLVRHPDLAGLDSVAELFAVDAPEARAVPRPRLSLQT